MIQSLHNYSLLIVSLLTVTQLTATAEEATGSSAVPYYKATPKSQPPTQKPVVSSIGRVSTSSGVIYAIADNGDLLWYRHDGRGDGSFKWADNKGRKVGQGWDVKQVFSGGNGVIYTIDHDNNLMWYRHDGRDDGSFKWADNKGRKVGQGWDVKQVFSD